MIPAAFPPTGGKDRNMIKKYEDACRKAGLSEKKTQEIRRVFERDRERWIEKFEQDDYEEWI